MENLTGGIKLNECGSCEELKAHEARLQKHSVIYDPPYATT